MFLSSRNDSSKRQSALSVRRVRSVESYRSAQECIGTIEPGLSLFAVTRGQFSMLDAITACLDQVGSAEVSIWTWTVAAYELDCFERFASDGRITDGLLVVDGGARGKNAELLWQWQRSFGENSVRYVLNHAKIATIQTDQFRILLRGSMNLNFNPRFEQFDLTEGGADFELVKEIERGLPVLAMNAPGSEVYRASNVGSAFGVEQLKMFQGCRTWAK